MRHRAARFAILFLLFTTPLLGVTRRWTATGDGAVGAWTDENLWSPQGVPQTGDDLLLDVPGNYSCNTAASFAPRTLVVGGGNGTRAVEVTAGTNLTTLFSTKFNQNADITVNGTLDGQGEITVNQAGTVRMKNGSTLAGTGPFFTNVQSTLIFENSRIIRRPIIIGGNASFTGLVTVSQGVEISNGGATVITGGITPGDTSVMSLFNEGSLTIQGPVVPVGIDLTNEGTLTVTTGSTLQMGISTYKQTGGTTTVAPTATLAAPVDLAGGTLTGSGTVQGNVTNGATVALATPVTFASMQINGDYTQTAAGTLEIKIGSATQFDRLFVSGLANLAGRLSIRVSEGFIPAIGATFPILTFGARSGDFTFFDGTDLGDIEMVPVYTPSGLSLVAQVKVPCTDGRLCLNQGRFEVSLSAKDPRTGNTGAGQPVRQNDIFGYFSIPDLTQNPSNPEVFVKILDGRDFNGKFWVFYGSLTDFELSLTVLDTQTQATKTYTRPGGEACGEYDVGAFGKAESFEIVSAESVSTELHAMRLARLPIRLENPEPSPEVGCVTTATSLCLSGSRFSVALEARDQRTGTTATGQTLPRNDFFGYFTLPELTGDPANVEVFVKILDGRAINGKFWVFFGGLTDLEYTLTVRDAETAAAKVYTKEAGSPCGQFDTDAF